LGFQIKLIVVVASIIASVTAHSVRAGTPPPAIAPVCAAKTENGLQAVCSTHWKFEASCGANRDLWDQWEVTPVHSGRVEPDHFARPWLDKPIVVIGYEMVKIRTYPVWRSIIYALPFFEGHDNSWFMVGSTMLPDPVIWLAPGESHIRQFYPVGYGQPWPVREDHFESQYGAMLDIHGVCKDGGRVTLYLTIYYVPAGASNKGETLTSSR
jgi:hypothetical protein